MQWCDEPAAKSNQVVLNPTWMVLNPTSRVPLLLKTYHTNKINNNGAQHPKVTTPRAKTTTEPEGGKVPPKTKQQQQRAHHNGTMYLVPSTLYQVLGTKYLVLSTWYQVLGTKYLVPSAWYQVLGILDGKAGTHTIWDYYYMVVH